jgi:hypothetical protein
MDGSQLLTTLTLTLCTLFGGCGNLSKLVHLKSPILVEEESRFSLTSLYCNQSTCEESTNPLHKQIGLRLRANLSSKGYQVSDQHVDFYLLLISAYEGDIEHHSPRNLYLVIRNAKGKELGQLAVAESFSSPLNQNHVDLKEVEEKLISDFNDMISTDPTVASTTN